MSIDEKISEIVGKFTPSSRVGIMAKGEDNLIRAIKQRERFGEIYPKAVEKRLNEIALEGGSNAEVFAKMDAYANGVIDGTEFAYEVTGPHLLQ